jgi:hypothetical protein
MPASVEYDSQPGGSILRAHVLPLPNIVGEPEPDVVISERFTGFARLKESQSVSRRKRPSRRKCPTSAGVCRCQRERVQAAKGFEAQGNRASARLTRDLARSGDAASAATVFNDERMAELRRESARR